VIALGWTPADKAAEIRRRADGMKKVVICSPKKFDFPLPDMPCPVQWVDWPEIIMYRTFYPLLQEIDARTLVVVNECLRTQNRHDLTYNCIRHYLNQAGHVLVYQWLPCIDTMSDFMTLFDFATGSRWKRTPWDVDPPEPVSLRIVERAPVFAMVPVAVDARTEAQYTAERARLFAGIGGKDPHTIPRNLYLIGGKAKAAVWSPAARGLGRNARLGIEGIATYKDDAYPNPPYTVIELPHNFIDLADVSALSGQTEFRVMATSLKADQWYCQRFSQWAQRIQDGYASLRSWPQCP
jgi:hypothetical protein